MKRGRHPYVPPKACPIHHRVLPASGKCPDCGNPGWRRSLRSSRYRCPQQPRRAARGRVTRPVGRTWAGGGEVGDEVDREARRQPDPRGGPVARPDGYGRPAVQVRETAAGEGAHQNRYETAIKPQGPRDPRAPGNRALSAYEHRLPARGRRRCGHPPSAPREVRTLPVTDAAMAQQVAALSDRWPSGMTLRLWCSPVQWTRVATAAGSRRLPVGRLLRAHPWGGMGAAPGPVRAAPAVEVCTPRAAAHLASQLRAGSEGVRDLHGASEGGTALRSDPQVLHSSPGNMRIS